MRKAIFYLLIFFSWVSAGAQDIGTSPLEYNPDKFFRTFGSMTETSAGTQKSLYPLNSLNFYIYDTLSLPIVDDFTTYRFKNYDQWGWQSSTDSIAVKFRFDTLPDAFPFTYKLDTTWNYIPHFTTPPTVDSTRNPEYRVVIFGNSENPFIPVDTISVWEITSKIYRINPLTQAIDSFVVTSDGQFTVDSTDTINVYRPLPDSALWTDNFAYRNFSMGVNPPTIGVVTFDGTNEFGKAYSPGQISSYGVADYLTSVPIDLNYPAADSIYLSFFYQPQGLGYDPAQKDSLVLEFYSPVTKLWHHVLKIKGGPLDTFRQKMVPIKDTLFLKDGFRFRFKNYANLSGNADHWNLDYIRLDRNRTAGDTIIEDVAFVQVLPTILRRYTAMPYKQLTQPEVNPKWRNYISNLFNQDKTICYKFELTDENGTVLNRYTEDYTPVSSDTNTIQPTATNGYTTYSRWYEPNFNYIFPLPLTDSARFFVKHYIQNFSPDVNADNDTVLIEQRFYNYFSYDDGTAEQALWLGTPGYVAVKFKNNVADTLRAIQFYFSPIREDVNGRFITVKVWSGDLQTEVYSFNRQVGVINGDPTAEVNPYNNGFTTFYLHDTAVVLPAGDFYVGWYQNQSFKLNVGFDKNWDSHENIYYKTTGEWDTLSLDGSVMIRPMMGPPFSLEDVGVDEPEFTDDQLVVFPNPSQETVYYSGEAAWHVRQVQLMDISGKTILLQNNPSVNQIDVSALPNGFYFIRFGLDGSDRVLTRKIIVSH